MLQTIVLLTAAIALIGALVMYFVIDKLAGSKPGWLAATFTICALPLLATGGGATYAVHASSSTEFCLACHEMGDYGRSLFIDDSAVLPATHYQNRLVERDHACYACHTDYAMWGDLAAKLNGLQHVYVHYLGEIPDAIELYQPYPNDNCLHCHADARRYTESLAHRDRLDALARGETSCLSCHSKGHALDQVDEGNFWLGPQGSE